MAGGWEGSGWMDEWVPGWLSSGPLENDPLDLSQNLLCFSTLSAASSLPPGGFSKANILCPESLLGLVLSILPHILYVLTSFNHCNSVECFHALGFIDEETGA